MQCRALCLIKIICPISFSFFPNQTIYIYIVQKSHLYPPTKYINSTGSSVYYSATKNRNQHKIYEKMQQYF